MIAEREGGTARFLADTEVAGKGREQMNGPQGRRAVPAQAAMLPEDAWGSAGAFSASFVSPSSIGEL